MSLSAAANNASQKNSRRPFFITLAFFFAPLAVSFLIYYGTNWRPAGDTSHGDLITPARPLSQATLPMPDGKTTAADFLKGKWSMVYVGGGSCADECRRALTDMRQVRLALNEEMPRVQRVFLYNGTCCDEQYFGVEQLGLIRAALDTPEGATLLALFPDGAGRTYLVDPLGNLMMSYEPGAPAKGMLEDLKKLLKYSHIG